MACNACLCCWLTFSSCQGGNLTVCKLQVPLDAVEMLLLYDELMIDREYTLHQANLIVYLMTWQHTCARLCWSMLAVCVVCAQLVLGLWHLSTATCHQSPNTPINYGQIDWLAYYLVNKLDGSICADRSQGSVGIRWHGACTHVPELFETTRELNVPREIPAKFLFGTHEFHVRRKIPLSKIFFIWSYLGNSWF